MGVKRLATYLKLHEPNAYCYNVDIMRLARYYKKKERKQPVIVVDGTSTLYDLIDLNSNDWLLGGQLQICKKQLRTFVDAFKAAGIQLVIFFDGSVVDQKRHVWVSRQTEKNKKQHNIFSQLRLGQWPSESLQPPLLGACGRFIYKYELGCEVIVSVGECDEEMAMYAQTNKCFAFLANDTDFVIHQGAHYFLSLRDLDIKTLNTICFNREALAESLSLDGNHLPLLASLMGNDIVPAEMLKNFHYRVCSGNNVSELVRRLANYIMQFPSDDLCRRHLTDIATYVFGDCDKAVFLEDSIQMYDCCSSLPENKNWDVMPEAERRHRRSEIPRFLYPLMRGQPYQLSVGLEYFDESMEALAKVYRPMRQRLYGVIFHDDPTPTDKVEEWCVEARVIDQKPLIVKVVKVPDKSHPGLLRLWTEDTALMNKIRQKLLAWCISPTMEESAFKHVQPRYHVLAAVLYYIVHYDRGLLSNWEVDAIIYQALLLRTMKSNQLMKLNHTLPEPRAVQVASLIGRGISTIILAMAACGISLREMMPWNYYDGRLFLQQYMLSKQGSGFQFQQPPQEQVQQDFESIWKFVKGK